MLGLTEQGRLGRLTLFSRRRGRALARELGLELEELAERGLEDVETLHDLRVLGPLGVVAALLGEAQCDRLRVAVAGDALEPAAEVPDPHVRVDDLRDADDLAVVELALDDELQNHVLVLLVREVVAALLGDVRHGGLDRAEDGVVLLRLGVVHDLLRGDLAGADRVGHGHREERGEDGGVLVRLADQGLNPHMEFPSPRIVTSPKWQGVSSARCDR